MGFSATGAKVKGSQRNEYLDRMRQGAWPLNPPNRLNTTNRARGGQGRPHTVHGLQVLAKPKVQLQSLPSSLIPHQIALRSLSTYLLGVHILLCMHNGGQRSALGHSSGVTHWFLETESLTNLKLNKLHRLTGQQASSFRPSLSPQCQDYRYATMNSDFTILRGPGDPTEVSMLTGEHVIDCPCYRFSLQ